MSLCEPLEPSKARVQVEVEFERQRKSKDEIGRWP